MNKFKLIIYTQHMCTCTRTHIFSSKAFNAMHTNLHIFHFKFTVLYVFLFSIILDPVYRLHSRLIFSQIVRKLLPVLHYMQKSIESKQTSMQTGREAGNAMWCYINWEKENLFASRWNKLDFGRHSTERGSESKTMWKFSFTYCIFLHYKTIS